MNLKTWVLASRPKTLWAGISPVLIGSALAWKDGFFHWPSALAALVGAVLIQIGTNFANDYFDFVKGADTVDRLGPVRATQAGLIQPIHMKRAFIAVFTLAFILGLYLVSRGGWPILGIGVLSILMGILYTGGPYPLGYAGFGDLMVLVFFGPVAVAGTYFVQSLHWSSQAWMLGIAPGLISVSILAVNNLRDVEQDRLSGKKTLVVRLGTVFGKWEYNTALNLASLIPFFVMGSYRYLILLVILLPALKIKMTVWHDTGTVLNRALAQTGALLFAFSVLLSCLLIWMP